MELLIGLLMNIIGADLYDRCPRLARWVLRKAVARLPENLREEYKEAWDAHLLDCDTKLDQIRHAIGCWWSVDGIARNGPKPKRFLRLDFIITGSTLSLLASTGEAAANLLHGTPWWGLAFYILPIASSAFVVVIALKIRRAEENVIEI